MAFAAPLFLIFIFITHLLIPSKALPQDSPKQLRKRLAHCDDNKFGRPLFDDCFHAWQTLPYWDDVLRQFVSVPVDAPVSQVGRPVELPLSWRHGSCRIGVANLPTPSGESPNEDLGTWTMVRRSAAAILHGCVFFRTGGTEDTGRRGGIGIYVYEIGSIWDRDHPSNPAFNLLVNDDPGDGETALNNIGQTSQGEQGTTTGGNSPSHQRVPTHALQCSAMYCVNGELCCEGYKCDSSPIRFAGAVKSILLGIQESLIEMASSCVPS